jgi:hypothetical protein
MLQRALWLCGREKQLLLYVQRLIMVCMGHANDMHPVDAVYGTRLNCIVVTLKSSLGRR